MDILLSIIVGVSLSAACGFRIFVPLLIVAIAARAGHLGIGESFAWLYSDPALIALSIATVLEIVAYYIPCVDNFLDVLGAPAAVVAGTILTASFVTDVSPWLQWSLGVICGGGAAGLVHGGMMAARGMVTATTAGLGNGIVSTGETVVSTTTSLLALFAPVLAAIAVLGIVGGLCYLVTKRFRKRTIASGSAAS